MPPNDLKINYPFKPYIITQPWGNPNSAYATQFNDPNFKLHNGIDAVNGYQNWDGSVKTEFGVYCPVAGFQVYKVDYAPQGGGNEIWMVSKEPLQMFDLKTYAVIVLCHAKKIFLKPGDEPALGELVMIADNTGFSTGLHTHMGLYRVEWNGYQITKQDDNNQATGSFDPALFFTGEYAVDLASTTTLVKSGLRYASYYLGA